MRARWFIAAATLALGTPAAAQWDIRQYGDLVEHAMVAGDYKIVQSDPFVYTENGNVLKRWDGMWNTLSDVASPVGSFGPLPPRMAGRWLDYRVEIVDGQELVRLIETDENTVQGVTLLHLKLADGKLARVDVLPIREEFTGARGGTVTLLQPTLPVTMDGERVGPADDAYQAFIFKKRNTRAALLAAVDSYLAGMLASSSAHVRFAPDCRRRDNGQLVTGVQDAKLLDPAKPLFRPFALGCAAQLDSGYYTNIRQVRDRHYWVDPARGLVLVQAQMDVPGTVLSFTAPGFGAINYPGPRGPVQTNGQQFEGRILDNMISPMTMSSAFLFKIDGGAIRRIDAFYRGAPYGWRLGW